MSLLKTALPLAAVTAVSLLSAAPALAADRDHDGMSDRWEHRYHVRTARFDADHDGLSNVGEFRLKTNPRRADTDRDGISDGAEKRLGTDPAKAGDGQGDVAAAAAAFAADVLTLTLADGRTVTARVTAGTEVKCRVVDAPAVAAVRHRGRDAEGDQADNSGPGNAEDRGDQVDNSGPGNADDSDDAGNAASGDQPDNSGPGNAGDRCTPEQLAGATVRKAEMRLGADGLELTKLELVATR